MLPPRVPEESPEPAAPGIGCALLVVGLVGAAFGLVALLGISDRVELAFFEIDLNDLTGRLAWTAGCLAVAWVGWLVVQVTREQD